MGSSLATVIVEPRVLVREALKSLMANNSFHVVCDVGCTAEISVVRVSDEPELVVLGAQSVGNAVDEAVAIRKLWSASKIIWLYEHASTADVQNLPASEINGCVPLSASPDTLIGMIERRLMVLPGSECPPIQPARTGQARQPEIAMDGSKRHGGEPNAISTTMAPSDDISPAVNGASTSGRALPKLSEAQSHGMRDAPLPVGTRILTPAELAKRKAELEARDGTRYVMPNSRIRASGRIRRYGKW